MAEEMITSVHEMFEGETFPKPKLAMFSPRKAPGGGQLWICPNCAAHIGEDDCDVLGAEPNCLFCNKCNREFEMP